MKKIRFLSLIGLLLLLGAPIPAQAGDSCCNHVASCEETDSFLHAEHLVRQAAKRHHPENVLFVVDIDNTLLTTNNDLGGDAWFRWCEKTMLNPGHGERKWRIADSGKQYGHLLMLQGWLYASISMQAPEAKAPAVVRRCQDLGVTVIVSTSRGLEYRASTHRELKRSGYDFRRTAIQAPRCLAHPHKPWMPGSYPSYGISPEEAETWGLKSARPITYEAGIMMGAGQHKGALLRSLLHRSDSRFKAVIFLDDGEKNVGNVLAAFKGNVAEVHVRRYTAVDPQVDAFNNGDDPSRRIAAQRLLCEMLSPVERADPNGFLATTFGTHAARMRKLLAEGATPVR